MKQTLEISNKPRRKFLKYVAAFAAGVALLQVPQLGLAQTKSESPVLAQFRQLFGHLTANQQPNISRNPELFMHLVEDGNNVGVLDQPNNVFKIWIFDESAGRHNYQSFDVSGVMAGWELPQGTWKVDLQFLGENLIDTFGYSYDYNGTKTSDLHWILTYPPAMLDLANFLENTVIPNIDKYGNDHDRFYVPFKPVDAQLNIMADWRDNRWNAVPGFHTDYGGEITDQFSHGCARTKPENARNMALYATRMLAYNLRLIANNPSASVKNTFIRVKNPNLGF